MDRRIARVFRTRIGRNPKRLRPEYARTNPAHHDSIAAARTATVPRRMQPRRKVGMPDILAAAAVGVTLLALPTRSSSADLNTDRPDTVEASTATATARQGVRVQPRAWEFAPPYRQPDLSPESARNVDRLYDELIGWTPSKRGTRPNMSSNTFE